MPGGGAATSTGSELLRRHAEIRSALSFFLQRWYRHRQAGTAPDKATVLADFVRFRSLDAVTQRLATRHPQVASGSAASGRGQPRGFSK